MVESDLTQNPRDFYDIHKFLTVTEYFMFVNGIEFLITLSKNIRFHTF